MALRTRIVPTAATFDLRSRVLREGRPHEGFPDDDDAGTVHVGAEVDGTLVGVATFVPRGEGIWQLRAMAVDVDRQGRGVGRAVLEAGIALVEAEGATLVWANGRDTAIGFYERLGWRVVGEGYEVIGLPHHRVERTLTR